MKLSEALAASKPQKVGRFAMRCAHTTDHRFLAVQLNGKTPKLTEIDPLGMKMVRRECDPGLTDQAENWDWKPGGMPGSLGEAHPDLVEAYPEPAPEDVLSEEEEKAQLERAEQIMDLLAPLIGEQKYTGGTAACPCGTGVVYWVVDSHRVKTACDGCHICFDWAVRKDPHNLAGMIQKALSTVKQKAN